MFSGGLKLIANLTDKTVQVVDTDLKLLKVGNYRI